MIAAAAAHGDHLDDVQLSLRGEHAGRDEGGLAGERHSAGLEHHDQEERDQPVVVDEAGHRSSVGLTS